MPEVFKLQRPLGGDMTRVLAYNKSRSVMLQVPFDDDMKAFFGSAGAPLKLYVMGEVQGTRLHLVGAVEPQPW